MAWYIDIDGTLTDKPRGGGKPRMDVIEKVKDAISRNWDIYIWTAGSPENAKKFCESVGIYAKAYLPKPTLIVDDNRNLRPRFKWDVNLISPEEFLNHPLS